MNKPLGRIERALSAERLSPYRRHGGDLRRAVDLYEWNTAASAAIWLDIANLEVLVRNAMHRQLTDWAKANYGHGRWYDDPGRVLSPRHRDDVDSARQRLNRAGKRNDAGRIVAELGFGFWRYLVASQYDRALWVPTLRTAFPGQPRRRPVHDRLTRLHHLRNRIAHHEPIYRMPLAQHLSDMLDVVEWVDPRPTELDHRPVHSSGRGRSASQAPRQRLSGRITCPVTWRWPRLRHRLVTSHLVV
ncbi:hypothetical protein E1262_27985 [Jiangella aurantiaca]|uniref:Abi family protein n=1 Tax=Jiangella aurantiaca TaxID=2530373 RepID=A0A4R5A4R7_9ACTN|nr:hypothetical protein [Jiangella aurantiaca]TDD64492.1 hypothetical protein E1262_27985 [Jiangella aurantiaca]